MSIPFSAIDGELKVSAKDQSFQSGIHQPEVHLQFHFQPNIRSRFKTAKVKNISHGIERFLKRNCCIHIPTQHQAYPLL